MSKFLGPPRGDKGDCQRAVLLSTKDIREAIEIFKHLSKINRDYSYPLPNTRKTAIKPVNKIGINNLVGDSPRTEARTLALNTKPSSTDPVSLE